jgi:hypothetical protein
MDIGGKLHFHDCTLLLTARGAHRTLSDAWQKLPSVWIRNGDNVLYKLKLVIAPASG